MVGYLPIDEGGSLCRDLLNAEFHIFHLQDGTIHMTRALPLEENKTCLTARPSDATSPSS